MSVPEVSVVIPVRNRPHELVKVLEAIGGQDYPRDQFEVLVCDDGSTADIRTIAEDARRSGLEVNYFRQPARGPATARNLGIRNARGSIVAMTDSDTRPDRGWLSSLVRTLKAHPEAAGVEGKVICRQRR